ncbi:hypothetical protein CMI37_23910 [Candidatus Pacearchaeota archaeon]|nr:hypothetical protein [Candidatus Pacearchaeota archaeon]
MATVDTQEALDIKLAVYMERLDSYIESQTKLNEKMCSKLESLDTNLDELYEWKSKLTGMKSAYLGVGLLFIHTIAIMGGLTALFKWFLSGDK